MTRYLIDSNILIEASNRYYGTEFCPAFWTWLSLQFHEGRILSIHPVAEEVSKRDDTVSKWVANNRKFFLMPDSDSIVSARVIGDWMQSQNFRSNAVREFADSTDHLLIAYAMTHACTVVTQEVRSDGTKKVKIPNVCEHFNVPCVNTFEMLRTERPTFVLQE